jgi:hypothetical protein
LLAQVLSGIGRAFEVLKTVRAPLLVALFGALLLAQAQQVQEIYRILIEDLVSPNEGQAANYPILRAAYAFLFVVFCTFTSWMCSRILLRVAQCTEPKRAKPKAIGILLPVASAVLIPAGICIGLYAMMASAHQNIGEDKVVSQVSELSSFFAQLEQGRPVVWGIVAGLGTLVGGILVLQLRFHSSSNRPFVLIWLAASAVLILAVAAGGAIAFQTWQLTAVGSLPIFLAFLAMLTAICSALTGYFDKFRVPSITIIFVFAALLSFFDLNDNHEVETIQTAHRDHLHVRSAFEQWYDSRQDRSFYEEKGEPYPVFIVTAAGGGQYAAYHAAMVLAKLQDRCPNFAQHVFAISAVSGGSVGAALFSGLAKTFASNGHRQPCTDAPSGPESFEHRAHRFLKHDLLSPILASALFPDFLQRFLPVAVPQFDRARAFDRAMESAWEEAAPGRDNQFKALFRELWDPSGASPALVLNTTEIQTGFRTPFAPFQFTLELMDMLATLYGQVLELPGPGTEDVKLSTAVGLSARFPWILPAGTLKRPDGRYRLVDGGYFENSGVETASDLLLNIKHYENKSTSGSRHIRIHFIVIKGMINRPTLKHTALNEVLTPLRGMLSTRSSRGDLAAFRASTERWPCVLPDPSTQECDDDAYMEWPLATDLLPLGWHLSQSSMRLLQRSAGLPEQADTKSFFQNADRSAHKLISILNGTREVRARAQERTQMPQE